MLGWSRLAVILCAGFPSFYRLWAQNKQIVCRFPLQIDRPSSQLFSSPRSSSSYIRMLTLQITQEEIDVMTRSGARSSITSTIFKIVPSDFHGRGSPMWFNRRPCLSECCCPDLGDDGLDLCFSLLLPDFKAQRRKAKVHCEARRKRTGNMLKNFKSESKKLL